MRKSLILLFLILFFAAPALAKPMDVYQVSCDDLWAALKVTLGDQRNYGVVSTDDFRQSASFVVVGALTHYTQGVVLTQKKSGCWVCLRASPFLLSVLEGDSLKA